MQDSTSLFEINNEGLTISKLVSQLKLLPSLIELRIAKSIRYVTN